MVNKSWEITQKHKKYWKIVKTRSPSVARHGHPWTKKRSKNGHFAQRRVFFTLSLGCADVFGRRSCPKRQKTLFLGPRSSSKHALEKVLTSETPCIRVSSWWTIFRQRCCWGCCAKQWAIHISGKLGRSQLQRKTDSQTNVHVPAVVITRHQATPANAGGDWLHPFTEGLVEEPLVCQRQREGDSTQDAEPQVQHLLQGMNAKPTSKHNLFTHFPTETNCEVCKIAKNCSCQTSKTTWDAHGWYRTSNQIRSSSHSHFERRQQIEIAAWICRGWCEISVRIGPGVAHEEQFAAVLAAVKTTQSNSYR